jgi:hypothetical protein
MLPTGIDSLDDTLGIRTIIWLDDCGSICGKNGRGERKGVEICSFSYLKKSIDDLTDLFAHDLPADAS